MQCMVSIMSIVGKNVGFKCVAQVCLFSPVLFVSDGDERRGVRTSFDGNQRAMVANKVRGNYHSGAEAKA